MNLDLQKVLPAEAFETEQNEGDYIGKDGLLYCGVCRTKKQTRLPASDFTGGREIIVPCICKCKVEENKRKEEEEKKRQEMQRLESRFGTKRTDLSHVSRYVLPEVCWRRTKWCLIQIIALGRLDLLRVMAWAKIPAEQ